MLSLRFGFWDSVALIEHTVLHIVTCGKVRVLENSGPRTQFLAGGVLVTALFAVSAAITQALLRELSRGLPNMLSGMTEFLGAAVLALLFIVSAALALLSFLGLWLFMRFNFSQWLIERYSVDFQKETVNGIGVLARLKYFCVSSGVSLLLTVSLGVALLLLSPWMVIEGSWRTALHFPLWATVTVALCLCLVLACVEAIWGLIRSYFSAAMPS